LPARGPSKAGRLVGLGPKNYMYYVYIIHSQKSNKLYKGSTADLKQRIKEHNSEKVKSTKSGVPWTLLYYEAFTNKTDALIEERFLKSGKGKERIKYLFKNYFNN
jgi:putative endonuclease